MKWLLGIVSLLIIVAGVAVFVLPAKAPVLVETEEHPVINISTDVTEITINSRAGIYTDMTKPVSVGSPVSVTGSAKGYYFEGSFPIILKDSKGKVLAQVPAKAIGDWMTSDPVPFSAILTFDTQPVGSKGTLVLHNDNPSGLPENDKSVSIPVVFK